MKKIAKNLIKHPLISGSIILVFGTLFANLFNLFFSILMGRLLTPVDFGTLQSINAICAFPIIAANAVTPLIIILAGAYFAEKKYDLISGLYMKFTKIYFTVAVILSALFLVFIPQINSFFNITDYNLLLIADGIIFFSLMLALNFGFMQAKLAFKYYVFILCASTIIKLISSWILVVYGLGVNGAISGLFLGTFLPYLLSFIPFKFILKQKIKYPVINSKIFITYGVPAALIGIGLSAYITNDLILVKHFFPPNTAGIYAGLSLIGRIIFYVSAPVTNVMFPLIVQQYTKKEKYANTFLLALFLVMMSSVLITLVYSLFPEFSILMILKREYFEIIPYLSFFSLSIAIYSLLSVFASFFLSIKKTIITIPILLVAGLQIALICYFHQSIQQIVTISFVINITLFFYLLAYYLYFNRKYSGTKKNS